MGKVFGGDSPKVVYETRPLETRPLEEEAKKSKAARSALIATEGGMEGEEVMAGGVKKRNTLLGN